MSVVVPARNEGSRIARCLEALSRQSYPRDSFEVVVVDNNSTDDTAEIARSLGVRCVSESIQNAENARNTGAHRSSGGILAFTDADCVADKDWIASGVTALRRHDLVAGHVQFTSGSSGWTLWETYDAVFNLQHAQSVAERGVAFTANIFLWRQVFEDLGGFPEDSLGGGDLLLTRRATREGRSLGYEENAVVVHPARPFAELKSKALRIGAEKGAAWSRNRAAGGGAPTRSSTRKPHLVGVLPGSVRERMERQSLAFRWATYLGLLACNLVYLGFGFVGFCQGLFSRSREEERPAADPR